LSDYECFIPATDYTDPDIGRREREKLWPKVWQVACREEEIPKVGDYVKYDIAGESILVVRVEAERIAAFYNVCQHRGRQLVDRPQGTVAAGFYCRYHGWRYTLEGALSHVHWREDWGNCPAMIDGSLNLKQPRVGQWAGWVWINMDPDAPSLEDYLGEAPEVLKAFHIEDMRLAWYETLIVDVNWKVVIEAFNEGYHVGATHHTRYDYTTMRTDGFARGLHASFSSAQGVTQYIDEHGQWAPTKGIPDQIYRSSRHLFEDLNALNSEPGIRALNRLREELPEDAPPDIVIPRMFELYREEIEATGAVWPKDLTAQVVTAAQSDWHIFPNTVFLPTVDGILWYRMRPHPDDDQSCVFDIWCLRRFPPGGEPKVKQHISHSLEEFKGRNTFLEQDFSNLRGVQLGMKSRGFKGAFTNPTQELPISHFHRVLHQYIGG
jgi:phenylpropionate dioxygenase-like ring-hydroxylating dioxygenase large terminal subunit